MQRKYAMQYKINMAQLILQPWVIDAIKANATLYGKVAESLRIAPASLPRLLYRNDERLTQATVLAILRSELDCKDNELLENKMQVA